MSKGKQIAISFVSGLIFAIGLVLGGMTQPSKVVGFLDFFGCGSEVWHLDGHHVERELGEHLLLHRHTGKEAAHDQEDHQQVRCNGITSKPIYD